MKKIFPVIALLLCAHCFAQTQTTEEDAIKKICLAETIAYANLDYNAWASYHVQSKDEQLNWNEPNASFGFQSGWDEISTGMKDWFKTAKKEDTKISSDNYTIVIRGDMAFAAYSTSTQTTAGKTTKLRESPHC